MQASLDSSPATCPSRVRLRGRYVSVVPLDPARHGEALWRDTAGSDNDDLWTYLGDGPFDDRESFLRSLHDKAVATDRVYFAVVDAESEVARGYLALLRIDVVNRVIEVGSILYGKALQRTRGGTEAMFLVARHVFEDLGYRRYEWKCDALNDRSRRAARRLGFTFEGIFRQHMIVKGANRDTAWFSMLDSEWPARKAALEAWLEPDNFEASGRQRRPLAARAEA